MFFWKELPSKKSLLEINFYDTHVIVLVFSSLFSFHLVDHRNGHVKYFWEYLLMMTLIILFIKGMSEGRKSQYPACKSLHYPVYTSDLRVLGNGPLPPPSPSACLPAVTGVMLFARYFTLSLFLHPSLLILHNLGALMQREGNKGGPHYYLKHYSSYLIEMFSSEEEILFKCLHFAIT